MENNTNTNQEIEKDTKGLKMFNKSETPAADDNSKKKKTVKRVVTAVIALILLIGGLVFAPGLISPKGPGNVNLTTGEDIAAPVDLSDKYVSYAGIPDATISSESVVQLKNLEENDDIIMKFQVYEGDKMLYETDYIPSGQYLNWEAGKELKNGAHNLSLVQTPMIEVDGEYIPLTSGTCEFTLTKV